MLRALGLGDFLTAIPALRALRRGLPDHRLTLAAPRSLEPLVRMADVADALLDHRDLGAITWPHRPPALAVNLHGKGPQSHRLLQAVAPTRLVAFGSPDAAHDGPRWDAAEHEVARWCRLVREALAIPADPTDLRLRIPARAADRSGGGRPVVVLHPGAAYESRRWPVERWSLVARYLADRGRAVVVTGSADEVDRAQAVLTGAGLSGAGAAGARNLAGRTDLVELVELVAGAELLVSGDTGVAHVATAVGTASVLLFGPTSPVRWGPPDGGPHRVLWHGDGSGDPWAERPDPALLRITAVEVLASLDELLGELDTEPLREPLQGPR